MASSTRQAIDRFLASRRIAVAGVSRHERDFTRGLFRELRTRGYDVVPVHPEAEEIDGLRCHARVTDIQPPVEAALLFTTGDRTEDVVRDCAAAGVGCVWMYRAIGPGAVSPAAVQFCHDHGISVVPGECVYMFLPAPGFIHSAHGWVKKVVGSYPK